VRIIHPYRYYLYSSVIVGGNSIGWLAADLCRRDVALAFGAGGAVSLLLCHIIRVGD
jgi:hypothetical protein